MVVATWHAPHCSRLNPAPPKYYPQPLSSYQMDLQTVGFLHQCSIWLDLSPQDKALHPHKEAPAQALTHKRHGLEILQPQGTKMPCGKDLMQDPDQTCCFGCIEAWNITKCSIWHWFSTLADWQLRHSVHIKPHRGFWRSPAPVRRKIQGIGNVIGAMQKGTFTFSLEDDEGKVHKFRIPNSYYAPQAKCRLISPQHVAQELQDFRPNPHGTWCATYHDKIVLSWSQNRYQQTILLDKKNGNVGSIHSAPGFSRFNAFCAGCAPEAYLVAHDAGIVLRW